MGTLEHGTPTNTTCHGSDCPHKGSATLMTCDEAVIRYRGDYPYMKAVNAGTATAEKETYTTPKPPRMVLETVEEAAARPVKKAKRKPQPRVEGPKRGRNTGSGHGTVTRARTCKTDCPNEAAGLKTCTEVAREYWNGRRDVLRSRPVKKHGTATGYNAGCNTIEGCPMPAGKTCMDVNRDQRIARRRAQGVKPQRHIEHGTMGGYVKFGCHGQDDCPATATGGVSCSQAHKAYGIDYRARKAMEKGTGHGSK